MAKLWVVLYLNYNVYQHIEAVRNSPYGLDYQQRFAQLNVDNGNLDQKDNE